MTIPDGEPEVQVAPGDPQTYFVVVQLTPNANLQNPHQFRVTHVTTSSSTAEDRDFDLPLSMQFAADVPSTLVVIPPPVFLPLVVRS